MLELKLFARTRLEDLLRGDGLFPLKLLGFKHYGTTET